MIGEFGFQLLKKLFKTFRAIDFRLAFSQEVEVGAVENVDFHFRFFWPKLN